MPQADAPSSSRLHPATELLLLASALLVIFGVPSPLVPMTIIVLTLIGVVLSARARVSHWLLAQLILNGPTLLAILLVQAFYAPAREGTVLFELGPAAVAVEGLAIALQLWLRVTALVGVCALFAFGTDSARSFDGMIALRAPLSLAYIVSASLTLVPLTRSRIGEAIDARAARGWDTTALLTRLRLIPGILTGLVITAIAQLDQRHDALVQRGFGKTSRPALARCYPDGRLQRLLRWVVPAASITLVVASVAGWAGLPQMTDLLGELVEG